MKRRDAGCLLVFALLAGGCSAPAPYTAPPPIALGHDQWSAGASGKGPAATSGASGTTEWAPAQPADGKPRGTWWASFADPLLDALETRLSLENLSLAAALARHDQAVALVAFARSAQSPTVDAGAAATHDRQSMDRPLRSATQPQVYWANTAGISINYELDVWGRVRTLVAAASANAQAAQADVENIRLSLQASLAEHYVALRGIDAQLRLYNGTIDNYRQALSLTERRYKGGIGSGLDVARAQAQLAAARAQLTELRALRAGHVHAIAVLVGELPQQFTITEHDALPALPDPPPGLPSELLQRRPDIAAAERRVAAAHAGVGLAQTAYYPTLSLGAVTGLQNAHDLARWIAAPNRFWLFGPAAALNLLDGGLRNAQLAQARAALEQAGLQYRATVLSAFQEVEDGLAALRAYASGIADQSEAAEAAERAANLAMSRYRDGIVTYLDVINAQSALLAAQRDLLTLKTRRLTSGVALVRALGGGWNAHSPTLASGASDR
jgi:NodT family efflux transporter outer membrane factor (OMF) lipoprotein